MIMNILSGNLAEGQSKDVTVQSKSSTQTVKSSELKAKESVGTLVDVEDRSLSTIEEYAKAKTHIFLKFTFTMEQLIINLFTGKSEEVSKNQTSFFSCINNFAHRFQKILHTVQTIIWQSCQLKVFH